MTEGNWYQFKITGGEFVRRIHRITQHDENRFALFLGAGCSASSGIPPARELVQKHWLPKLRDLCAPDEKDVDKWAKEQFDDYDKKNPAASYGKVMRRLFTNKTERQTELERLCENVSPGFGYAVLAALVAKKRGCFNTILTTNFDDMVADALYLFTSAKPLIIPHESLAGFVRALRSKPLIVKLHGDNRLSPLNIEDELKKLDEGLERSAKRLLRERGIIFMGYGGNDEGIIRMLTRLPKDFLPLGVYWVNDDEPKGDFKNWLESRNAIWVTRGNFDELMLLVQKQFELEHPDEKKFDSVFKTYHSKYKELCVNLSKLEDKKEDYKDIKDALDSADEKFKDWWSVYNKASRYEITNPEKAEKIYLEGIEKFKNSYQLLGNYAYYLHYIRKKFEIAEKYYKQAIKLGPRDDISFGNYATLLHFINKDYVQAEKFYKKAMEIHPDDAGHIANYAALLGNAGVDKKLAELYYEKAMNLEPEAADLFGNYCGFLYGIGKEQNAERYWEKSIKNNKTEKMNDLNLELWFYMYANGNESRRAEALKELKELIKSGDRSEFWDFSLNIERAKKQNHPEYDWLHKLADVIADREKPEILDDWEAWQKV